MITTLPRSSSSRKIRGTGSSKRDDRSESVHDQTSTANAPSNIGPSDPTKSDSRLNITRTPTGLAIQANVATIAELAQRIQHIRTNTQAEKANKRIASPATIAFTTKNVLNINGETTGEVDSWSEEEESEMAFTELPGTRPDELMFIVIQQALRFPCCFQSKLLPVDREYFERQWYIVQRTGAPTSRCFVAALAAQASHSTAISHRFWPREDCVNLSRAFQSLARTYLQECFDEVDLPLVHSAGTLAYVAYTLDNNSNYSVLLIFLFMRMTLMLRLYEFDVRAIETESSSTFEETHKAVLWWRVLWRDTWTFMTNTNSNATNISSRDVLGIPSRMPQFMIHCSDSSKASYQAQFLQAKLCAIILEFWNQVLVNRDENIMFLEQHALQETHLRLLHWESTLPAGWKLDFSLPHQTLVKKIRHKSYDARRTWILHTYGSYFTTVIWVHIRFLRPADAFNAGSVGTKSAKGTTNTPNIDQFLEGLDPLTQEGFRSLLLDQPSVALLNLISYQHAIRSGFNMLVLTRLFVETNVSCGYIHPCFWAVHNLGICLVQSPHNAIREIGKQLVYYNWHIVRETTLFKRKLAHIDTHVSALEADMLKYSIDSRSMQEACRLQ
ncbi:hypothetical protein BZG36_02060 [Bifiguratus adelaidae]|uniref:Transcription factor domain-containing protein n=1 Tax=Bifiguratus adelaidae TaxID=1938954 RepID=A0A261Y1Z8_9FUNG|nr:hypothetical protein BZG36_02060 [Bifiguratus adelaidae]